jgi:FkbM family methyltransferase
MTARERVRAAGFRAMCVRPVNAGLRTAVRPFRNLLPWGVVHSIPMVGEVHVDLDDGREIVLVSDGYDSLASRMYWSGLDGFEPESLRLFLDLCKTSRTVVDVGAHIGLYALLASADRPDTTTIAFEPVERNLRYLRGNVARNETPGLTVEPAAVGDHDGTIVLYIPQTTRLPATASVLENAGDEIVPTEVPIVSIDGYARAHGIDSIDLIKIDVEGAESAVLGGAAQVIREHEPAIICEILHGVADTDAATAMFEDTDYRFFLLTDRGLVEHDRLVGDPTYFFKNYLLIPDSQVAERLHGRHLDPLGRGNG